MVPKRKIVVTFYQNNKHVIYIYNIYTQRTVKGYFYVHVGFGIRDSGQADDREMIEKGQDMSKVGFSF